MMTMCPRDGQIDMRSYHMLQYGDTAAAHKLHYQRGKENWTGMDTWMVLKAWALW